MLELDIPPPGNLRCFLEAADPTVVGIIFGPGLHHQVECIHDIEPGHCLSRDELADTEKSGGERNIAGKAFPVYLRNPS
jgi:hypothetical protein